MANVNSIHPSMINEVMNCSASIMPKPGMMGTEFVGSDRYGVVCVSVDSPKRVTVCKLWGLEEGCEKTNPNIKIDEDGVMWWFGPRDEEDLSKWSLRKGGRWKEMNKDYSGAIHFGICDPYRDPDF